jgi:hypothetical protein
LVKALVVDIGTLLPIFASIHALMVGTEPRQSSQKMKALKIEDIKPQTKVPGSKRIRILYGPYKLRAANVSLMPFLTLYSKLT